MTVKEKRHLLVEDLGRLRLVSDLQVSPGSEQASFVVTGADLEGNTYHSYIWIAELESGQVWKLTHGPKKDNFPRWSPDGRNIAFISNRTGQSQIWNINISGGEAVQLTNVPGDVSQLTWSPQADQIAFICKDEKKDESDDKVKIVNRLRYRVNGEGILDERRNHLWVVSTQSGPAKQLTFGDWDDSAPSWQPGGKEIAFLSNQTEDRDFNNVIDLYLISTEGEIARKLTYSKGPIQSFSWSHDGNFIAFVGNEQSNQLGVHNGVWVLSLANGDTRNLTNEFERSVGDIAISTSWKGPAQTPKWSPGGDNIFFLASDSGNTGIYKAEINGETKLVVDGQRVCLNFDLSKDGKKLAFVATDPTKPSEAFVCSADGSDERQVTQLNKQLLEEVALSPLEHIQFSSDEYQIDGWILKPFNFESARAYPLILNVHGGPLAFFGNSFQFDEQFLAATGYMVLLTNPRGSSGYSEEFANRLRGDLGGRDYDDLMRAVDHVLELEQVDMDRLGVTGGSYGGYMTNCIITRTDRFQAAVTEKCISNFYSLYGTTDTTFLDCEWFFLGMPQDDPELYMDRSPITQVKNVKTPLLIIHGEEDLICPIEQAEQLFIALKRHNCDVKFLRFQGENHDLNRSGSPQARIERLSHILDWFEQYLKPTN